MPCSASLCHRQRKLDTLLPEPMSLVALQFWSDQCSERAVGLGFAAGGLARQPVSVEWLWYRLILLIQGPCFPFKMIKNGTVLHTCCNFN